MTAPDLYLFVIHGCNLLSKFRKTILFSFCEDVYLDFECEIVLFLTDYILLQC